MVNEGAALLLRALTLVLALSCLSSLGPSLARAETPASEARAQFERGVSLADRGEIDAAIEAFETAYRSQPHPAVLFNLGQAYSAGGRPLEAVRALRSYLELAAPVSPRKEQAEQLLRFNQARIGRLSIRVTPEHAELTIDGRSVGKARDVPSIDLSAGAHVISAQAQGYGSVTRQVSVRPWAEEQASVELVLDAAQAGPLGFGTLAVESKPRGAREKVDGVAYDGKPLAEGPHWLVVEHAGYQPYQQRVDVEAGATTRVQAPLGPLSQGGAQQLARRISSAGYVSAGTGIMLVATGTIVRLLASSDYDEHEIFSADEAADIQRRDDLAFGAIIAGSALVVSGAALWLTGRSLRKRAGGEQRLSARADGLTLRF
jgi:hypothetical protein